MKKTAAPKQITLIGRRWHQRLYGNTYHTTEIFIDGVLVHKTPKQYGYGDQYRDSGLEWLIGQRHLPARAEWHHRVSREVFEKAGITLACSVSDVRRERDL